MPILLPRPVMNSQRHTSLLRKTELTKKEPEKGLVEILKKHGGRNFTGRVTVRHQGGGEKRFYRIIDFKRKKRDIPAVVKALEYDPNRTASIALIQYGDGEKAYILAPDSLKVGDKIIASETADFKVGNALPLGKIPVGMPIHNIELRAGKGAQIVRSAGNAANIQAKEGKYANVMLPSGETRKITIDCYATIGQVSNAEWKNINFGKAGRTRHRGIRPSVRGVAMAPNAHPHGGGEGRSPVGMSAPKSYKGKSVAAGKKTRRPKKYSNKLIIKKRKQYSRKSI